MNRKKEKGFITVSRRVDDGVVAEPVSMAKNKGRAMKGGSEIFEHVTELAVEDYSKTVIFFGATSIVAKPLCE